MKKALLTLGIFIPSLALLSTPSFAFFCPSNLQQIRIGDSIDTVIQKCGKPNERKEVEAVDSGPQEWVYNVGVAGQGSLRLSVIIQKSRIINITANSMSMPTTTICGKTISVGDSDEQLKSTCGTPVLINKGSSTNDKQPSPLIQLHYDSRPPETLIFKDEKLTERKQGV